MADNFATVPWYGDLAYVFVNGQKFTAILSESNPDPIVVSEVCSAISGFVYANDGPGGAVVVYAPDPSLNNEEFAVLNRLDKAGTCKR